MIRAAKLEVELYEEVEADRTATGQALQAVLIASVAYGIGVAIHTGVWGLFSGIIGAIIGWVAWSAITYWVGTALFRTPQTSATYGELLRTLGFANSPRVLLFFVYIPILGFLIWLVVFFWTLVAGVIAVRQALDFSTARAVGTCVVGLLISFLVQYILHRLF